MHHANPLVYNLLRLRALLEILGLFGEADRLIMFAMRRDALPKYKICLSYFSTAFK